MRTIAQQEVYSFTSFAVVGEIELLLSDFSLSLKQVAAQMHFPDQAVFTKFYKRYTGQTPMQFRNRLKWALLPSSHFRVDRSSQAGND